MKYPRRFKPLLESSTETVRPPDRLTAVFAVCAVDDSACGWGGWMLEGAAASGEGEIPGGERHLPICDVQVCPRCGRQTFRTAARRVYSPSTDQSALLASDAAAADLEYE